MNAASPNNLVAMVNSHPLPIHNNDDDFPFVQDNHTRLMREMKNLSRRRSRASKSVRFAGSIQVRLVERRYYNESCWWSDSHGIERAQADRKEVHQLAPYLYASAYSNAHALFLEQAYMATELESELLAGIHKGHRGLEHRPVLSQKTRTRSIRSTVRRIVSFHQFLKQHDIPLDVEVIMVAVLSMRLSARDCFWSGYIGRVDEIAAFDEYSWFWSECATNTAQSGNVASDCSLDLGHIWDHHATLGNELVIVKLMPAKVRNVRCVPFMNRSSQHISK